MHDNAPADTAIATIEHLVKLGLKNDWLMERPVCFLDLNVIENLWSNVKKHL